MRAIHATLRPVKPKLHGTSADAYKAKACWIIGTAMHYRQKLLLSLGASPLDCASLMALWARGARSAAAGSLLFLISPCVRHPRRLLNSGVKPREPDRRVAPSRKSARLRR